MKLVLYTLSVLFALNLNAQSRLSVDPDFPSYGYSHEEIAILPVKSTINLRPRIMRTIPPQELKQKEVDRAFTLQKAMYSWFLKRRSKKKLWVRIQDINETNRKLEAKGIKVGEYSDYTPEQLAGILGVDAIVQSSYDTDQPNSEEVSTAVKIAFDIDLDTNDGELNMFIYDGQNGNNVMHYYKRVSGVLLENPDEFIETVMRKASRKTPYCKKRKKR